MFFLSSLLLNHCGTAVVLFTEIIKVINLIKDKKMKMPRTAFAMILLLTALIIQGCEQDNLNEPASVSDDDYIRSIALNSAFSNNPYDDDNLFGNETGDFDDLGAVPENLYGTDDPIDSLVKWGRRVSSVNVNVNISSSGDTMKTASVNRTINGYFIIVGYVGGQLDSTAKPYTEEMKRNVTFKRVDNRPNPRFNWRVYQYSAIDGQTTSPQTGESNIIINRVEYFRNGALMLVLNGPDFTGNIFTSRYFGGTPFFETEPGDVINAKVYVTSNQQDTDYVAFHWARNSFGFHRERFQMTSQTPNGNNFDRVYEKSYTIYQQHQGGIHNGFISANTMSSLRDNDPALFSSTFLGLPYKVRR